MQILQWLFRGEHDQDRKSRTFNIPPKREDINEKNAKGKEISLLKRDRSYKRTKKIEWNKHGSKNLKIFAFIYRKDIPNSWFYSTLNLKRLGSLNRRHFVHSTKMKREESSREVGIVNKADSAAHVGNKVLPITEVPLSSSAERSVQCDTIETKDQIKGDKKKPMSRMKELLRWAASAKTDKVGKFNGRKILMFRRRGTLKAVPDDDQVCSDSPKISFRWDVESCSTTSSSYSAISIASSSRQNQIAGTGHITCRKGNWITTDSECMPACACAPFFFFILRTSLEHR
ncbi:uncharacterized protein LOC133295993 isoform X2 [Gastrolobium bilobum]|uniref:uncharacterized protein LOC133295993 isoform X2 n=1 Tax=Gastrolobium bilobum TaxID=150636 RepID=UPI002AB15586|nr:uncharacterized protein LOC133295993 isoform X2 [Gastrolobium bilobum]